MKDAALSVRFRRATELADENSRKGLISLNDFLQGFIIIIMNIIIIITTTTTINIIISCAKGFLCLFKAYNIHHNNNHNK